MKLHYADLSEIAAEIKNAEESMRAAWAELRAGFRASSPYCAGICGAKCTEEWSASVNGTIDGIGERLLYLALARQAAEAQAA